MVVYFPNMIKEKRVDKKKKLYYSIIEVKLKRGIFITFEGPDGSGKTTHSIKLTEYLSRLGLPVVHTREPGGTSIAEQLRKVLLNPNSSISPQTELLLYEAARAQHTRELIRPALEQGKVVICERYADATVAYQGYGRKWDLTTIKRLNKIVTEGLEPDLTFLIDIDVKKGLARLQRDKRKIDRLEQETLAFHQRVRQGYLKLARLYPQRIKIIPGEQPEEKNTTLIQQYINKKFKLI